MTQTHPYRRRRGIAIRFGLAGCIGAVALLWLAAGFLYGACAQCTLPDRLWLASPLVPIAGLLAAASAWLLSGPRLAPRFNSQRGLAASMLAYALFAPCFGLYVHALVPKEPVLATTMFVFLALLFAPVPTWFVPVVGVLAGHLIGRQSAAIAGHARIGAYPPPLD